MEYDQPPRGRVMFDTRSQRFTVLADRCILQNKNIAQENYVGTEIAEEHRNGHRQPLSVLACLRGGTDR
jgi:hypothetical protein